MKIQTIKKITTIMNSVGAALSIIGVVFGAILFAASSSFLEQVTAFLEGHAFDELTGGYEVLGGLLGISGSLLGTMFGFIILLLAVITLASFLVPTIHGIVLWKKTDNYLSLGNDAYKKAAIRDGILKLIFNGLPCLFYMYDCFSGYNSSEFILIIYYCVICGLEIYALFQLNNQNA